MHPSALRFGSLFFSTYCIDSIGKIVIDIGSQDVNGSLRSFCPEDARYIGVDFVEGNNVDVILKDPYKLPFEDESVDFIVCSSVFEHSQFFWLLFLEIIRILKPAGIFYLNVPSNGYIHRYPVDSWRFYPDSGPALVAWAERNGYTPALLESFIGDKNFQIESQETWWNDYCAVFIKDVSFSHLHVNRILKKIEGYTNAHCDDAQVKKNEVFLTDDFLLIQDAKSKIDNLELQIEKHKKDNLALINPVPNLKFTDDFFHQIITIITRMASKSEESERKIINHFQQLQSEQATKDIEHDLAHQERDAVRISQLDQARLKIEEQLVAHARREKEFSQQLEELHREQAKKEENCFLVNKKIDDLKFAQLDQARLNTEIQLAANTRLEKEFKEKLEQLHRDQAEQKIEYNLINTKRNDQLLDQLNQAKLQFSNQLTIQANREKEFSEQIEQLHRDQAARKLENDLVYTKRDIAQTAQLDQARLQIENQLAREARREKEFSEQIEQFLFEQAAQKLENDLVYKKRENALVVQLDQARLQIESQLAIQVSREKEFHTQLEQLHIEQVSKKVASDLVHTTRNDELLAKIDQARLQIGDQFATQTNREKEFNEQLHQLCREQTALNNEHDTEANETISTQAAQLTLARLQIEKQLIERAEREKEFFEKIIEVQKNSENKVDRIISEFQKSEINKTNNFQKQLDEEYRKLEIANRKIQEFTLENQYLKTSYLKRFVLTIKNKYNQIHQKQKKSSK